MSKTNKSILVINTPSSCKTCRVRYDSYGECDICAGKDLIVDDFVEANTKPDWCPLISVKEDEYMPDVEKIYYEKTLYIKGMEEYLKKLKEKNE